MWVCGGTSRGREKRSREVRSGYDAGLIESELRTIAKLKGTADRTEPGRMLEVKRKAGWHLFFCFTRLWFLVFKSSHSRKVTGKKVNWRGITKPIDDEIVATRAALIFNLRIVYIF